MPPHTPVFILLIDYLHDLKLEWIIVKITVQDLLSLRKKNRFTFNYFLPFSAFQYIIPISVILVTHTQIIGIVRQRTQAATSFRHSNRADVTIKKNRQGYIY